MIILYVQDTILYVQDTILYVQDINSATLYVQDSNSAILYVQVNYIFCGFFLMHVVSRAS